MCTNTQLKTGRELRKRFVRILWVCCEQFSLRNGQVNFTTQNHKVTWYICFDLILMNKWCSDRISVDLLKLFTLQLRIMCLLEIICNNKIRLLRFNAIWSMRDSNYWEETHLYTGLYPGCTWSKNNKSFFPFMIPSITSSISKSTTRVVIIVVAVIAPIIFLHCKI